MDHLSRRQLLVGALGCAALSACSATPRYTLKEQRWPLSVPVSALGESGYVVIEGAGLAAPLLVSVEGEAYTTVELVCTHRACEVYPRRQKLICPCHGSEFGLRGEVIKGPAATPLARYATRRDGESLIIERGAT